MEEHLMEINLRAIYEDTQQRHYAADEDGNMTIIFDADDWGSQIFTWPEDIRVTITSAMN